MIKNFPCMAGGTKWVQYGPGGGATWQTVRNASSGGNVFNDNGSDAGFQCRQSGSDYIFSRGHYPVDLRTLPKGSKLLSAKFHFYFGSKVGNATGPIYLLPSTISDPTNCTSADYSHISFVNKGSISTVSFNNWNVMTLNVADITVGAINKFALTYADDLNNVAPGGEEFVTSVVGQGFTNEPYLEIEYRPPAGGSLLYALL